MITDIREVQASVDARYQSFIDSQQAIEAQYIEERSARVLKEQRKIERRNRRATKKRDVVLSPAVLIPDPPPPRCSLR